MRPGLIVELGTFKGTSLFSFAEGMQLHGVDSKLYGIDLWEEDSSSGKFDGDRILSCLDNIISTSYSDLDLSLIRSSFNDAVHRFDDRSVDILHIDWWHTYEAVTEDYHTWKGKVRNSGIILFHDIMVDADSFGVKRFWTELTAEKDLTLQFNHSNGLGILCNDRAAYEKVHSLIETNREQYMLNNYESVKHELFMAQYAVRELQEVKSTWHWQLKERVKSMLWGNKK